MVLMNKNEIDILQNYILKTAKSIAENSTLNIVKTGSIKSSEIGYYNAQLSTASDNSTVKAIALSDQQFLVGDIVYLVGAVAANGDEKNTTYYIFGRVQSIQEDFLNMSEWDRFRASSGTEWSSGKNEDGELAVYNYKEWTSDIILDNVNLLEDIRNKTYFAITGHFTAQGFNAITKFDPIASSYGLTISFVNDEDMVITDVNGNECSWVLDTNFFTGQPFNLNNSFQKRIIHVNLNPETAWKKIKISALTKNLDATLVNSNVMLFVSNLTLQAGFLTDLSSKMTVEVAAEDMKNYFYSTAVAADEVELQATVYYNQQILDSSNLRYYWFVKDDTITIGHDKWTEFGGEGWRCLNESQEVEASDGVITTTIRDWTDNSSSILLTRAKNYCEYFENTFKCVVRYGTVNATSQDFLVYDYKKYDATVTLTPDSKLILNKDDKVTLSIESIPLNSSTNVKPRHTDYRWTFTYANGEDTVNDTVYGSAIMYLKNSGNESVFEEGKNWKDEKVDIYSVYEIQGHPATIDCSCEVLFDFEEGDGEEIIRKTAIETISNKISEESEVEQINEYKYYIADTSFLSFERVLTEEKGYDEAGNEIVLNERKWNGDWKLVEWDEQKWTTVNLNTLPAGMSPFDYLLSDTQNGVPLGDNQYLFYTSRTVWVENSITLKETNWDYPSILKYSLTAGSPSLHGAAAAELNVFNSLTKGGSADGVFYAQGEYLLTEDTEWNDTKTYYIKNVATNDTITYSKINKDWTNFGEFDLTKTYYIRQVYQKVESPVQENLKSYYELSGSYYVTTSDTEIDEEKTYYIKLDNSTPIYIKYEVKEGSEPQAGQTYYIHNSREYIPYLYQTYAASGYGTNPSESTTPIYEQLSDDQKLYINATYIQTGTLRVGERGKEKFFATMNGDDVKIAGFTVSEDKLHALIPEEGEEDFEIYLGKNGFKVGNLLQVDRESKTASIAAEMTIAGTSGSTTIGDLNQKIIKYGERKEIVVYSGSYDKPQELPYDDDSGHTNIADSYSPASTALWFKTYDPDHSYWRCQKYDTSYINSEVPWGDIIQMAEMQPYSIHIDDDFIAIPSKADGTVAIAEGTSYPVNVDVKKGMKDISLSASHIKPKNNFDSSLLDLYLYYHASNVTVTYDQNTKKFVIGLLPDDVDSDQVIFELYYNGKLQTTATVEVVKQKAGADGSYVYAKANMGVINVNASDYPLSSSSSITVTMYRKIGDQAPIVDKSKTYNYTLKYTTNNSTVSSPLSSETGSVSFLLNTSKQIKSSVEITIKTGGETVDKIILNTVKNGASSYALTTDNSFIAVPCDSKGNILINNWSETINVQLFQGIQSLVLPAAGYPLVTASSSKTNGVDDFTVTKNDKDTFTISNMQNSIKKGKVTIQCQTGNSSSTIVASTTIEIVKQKAGADGSHVYALADASVLSLNANGKIPPGTTSKTVNITMYKRIGDSAPEVDTTGDYYYEVFRDGSSTAAGNAVSFEDGTASITFDNDAISGIGVLPASKAEIRIYAGKTSEGGTLVDKIILDVIKDGATGSSPYVINTDNPVILPPADSNGTVLSTWAGDDIKVWIQQGNTVVTGYTIQKDSVNRENNKFYLTYLYNAAEVTVSDDYSSTQTDVSFHVAKVNKSPTHIVFAYYQGNIKLTEYTVNITARPSGADGEDGEYVYAKASESGISVDANGKLKTSNGTKTISINVYRKKGSNLAERDITSYYALKIYGDSEATPAIWPGQKGDAVTHILRNSGTTTFTGKIPQEKLTIEVWQVKEQSQSPETAGHSIGYIDTIILNVTKDGETIIPDPAPPIETLQTTYYYVWSTSKIDPPDTDTLIEDVTDNNYYAWSDDFSSITFQTHEEWAPQEQDPVYWALEEDLFTLWSGREIPTNVIASNSNLGEATYVWKIQVTAYNDGTIGIWPKPVLMPELEAIELAAKYQIKNDTYVKSFAKVEKVEENYKYTYPIYANATDSTRDSITGTLENAVKATGKFNEDEFQSCFINNIPAGDIGRWCRLYNRTVISGGAIVTGSITADQIAAHTITAEKISVDDLHALEAKIGGWTIEGTSLLAGEGSNQVGLSSDSQQQERIWAGNDDPAIAPFRVYETGEMYSSKGTIGGWVIDTTSLSNINQNVFLHSSGNIGIELGNRNRGTFFKPKSDIPSGVIKGTMIVNMASQRVISRNTAPLPITETQNDIMILNGTITVSSIGIASDYNFIKNSLSSSGLDPDRTLCLAPVGYNPNANISIYLASDECMLRPLTLYQDGTFIATSANISGTINADSGIIGGWSIQEESLSNGHLTLYSTASPSDYSITSETIIEGSTTTGEERPSGYSFSVSKAGDLVALGNAQINEWYFQPFLIMTEPEKQNVGSVGTKDPFYSSGADLDEDKSVYMGSVIMPSTDVSGKTDNIILSKDKLYGIRIINDGGTIKTDILTMKWWDLLKAAHKSLGIKTGSCLFSASTDGEWRYIEIFSSSMFYDIVATARPTSTVLDTATMMTTWHWTQDSDGKMHYYVGRRGSNSSSYSVEVSWIATPISSSYIDFNTGNFNYYNDANAKKGYYIDKNGKMVWDA